MIMPLMQNIPGRDGVTDGVTGGICCYRYTRELPVRAVEQTNLNSSESNFTKTFSKTQSIYMNEHIICVYHA